MTKTEKKTLVNRLVGEVQMGWQSGRKAGRECALHHLTVAGFENVTQLVEPSFRKLRASLRNRGDTKQTLDRFWYELVGPAFHTLTSHPDFPRAFVEAVREVWDEVDEEVTAVLDGRPAQTEAGSAAETDEPPPRRRRRGPSRPRPGRSLDLGRRW